MIINLPMKSYLKFLYIVPLKQGLKQSESDLQEQDEIGFYT